MRVLISTASGSERASSIAKNTPLKIVFLVLLKTFHGYSRDTRLSQIWYKHVYAMSRVSQCSQCSPWFCPVSQSSGFGLEVDLQANPHQARIQDPARTLVGRAEGRHHARHRVAVAEVEDVYQRLDAQRLAVLEYLAEAQVHLIHAIEPQLTAQQQRHGHRILVERRRLAVAKDVGRQRRLPGEVAGIGEGPGSRSETGW